LEDESTGERRGRAEFDVLSFEFDEMDDDEREELARRYLKDIMDMFRTVYGRVPSDGYDPVPVVINVLVPEHIIHYFKCRIASS
jgi:hypothetical protein